MRKLNNYDQIRYDFYMEEKNANNYDNESVIIPPIVNDDNNRNELLRLLLYGSSIPYGEISDNRIIAINAHNEKGFYHNVKEVLSYMSFAQPFYHSEAKSDVFKMYNMDANHKIHETETVMKMPKMKIDIKTAIAETISEYIKRKKRVKELGGNPDEIKLIPRERHYRFVWWSPASGTHSWFSHNKDLL